MLFNSVTYVIFLPVCVLLYFITPLKLRNLVLLAASYFFYMCWVPQYALLMAFSTFTTWATGFFVDRVEGKNSRKLALALNIAVNLGILFTFKYYNFFTYILTNTLEKVGITVTLPVSSLLLPVGISFYTFQALGYSIDVYRRNIRHERNFFQYALFVSFFPQLVAGPIERTKNLLPQLKERHSFSIDRTVEGLRLILFGMFKKVAVSDMLALYVDEVFGNLWAHSGFTHILAILMFSVQIYCDFSGYSDVARGSARIFGFNLMENFNTPYFASSITNFWSRWHISLSTWFRDYLYIPLGGNRKGFFRKMINLYIIFVVSGLWHGASLSFIAWGVLHGLFRIAEEIMRKCVKPIEFNYAWCYRVKDALKKILCFAAVTLAWVFFRTPGLKESVRVIISMMKAALNFPLWKTALESLIRESDNLIRGIMPDYTSLRWGYVFVVAVALVIILICDIRKYRGMSDESVLVLKTPLLRWIIYYVCIFMIMFAFVMTTNEYGQAGAFLYFQF